MRPQERLADRPAGFGPFQPLHPIGRGASAEVWRAVFLPDDTPVALKILRAELANDAAAREAFRHEVRAVAGLDHPHVISILDHGTLPVPLSDALREGSPYLVMELAEGGALTDWRGRLEWPELRVVLEHLLGALAHAHARGVIHRDLKPGNVLVGGLRPGIKLTDFGLARPRGGGEGVAGTPAYMAPEQLLGKDEGIGPWTDLYALGGLVWTLVSGEPPHGQLSLAEARHAHHHAPLPSLERAVAVPEGLEGWLRRLLERDPGARFRRAADAAWALRAVGGPLLPPSLEPPEIRDDRGAPTRRRFGAPSTRTSSAAAATQWSALSNDTLAWMRTIHLDPARPGAERPVQAAPPVGDAPPLPEDWRGPHDLASPGWMELGALGLQLTGLRTISLVDRLAERDRLWQALREVQATRRPRVVWIEGVAGVGKSRLAGWLCERAHELGAAEVLAAWHGAEGEGAGLGGLLAREEGGEDPPPRTLNERVARAGRLLRERSRERPVLLWVEDAAWGPDSLRLAQGLLERADEVEIPALLLLTSRAEALVDPAATEAVQPLLRGPELIRLALAPLDEAHCRALVRSLAGLSDDTTAAIAQRSAGNPGFAVQIVADLVERGVLVPGARGYRLAPGAELALPPHLSAAWEERLDLLLKARPGGERQALEMAATLGSHVDGETWTCACAALGLEPAWGLVELLLEARLARTGAGGPREGWSFEAAMLRESALEVARRSGRAAALHRAAASALAARPASEPRLAERLGRHWLAAGEPARALEPLLAAARARRDVGEYGASELLLLLHDQAMAALGVQPPDPRWFERELSWVRLLYFLGRTEEAVPRAEALVRLTTDGPDRDLRVRVAIFYASMLRLRGLLRDALAALAAIEADAPALADRTSLFGLLRERARMLADLGQEIAAFEALDEALAMPTPAGQRLPEALAHLDRYRLLARTERLAEARAANEAARAIYQEHRHYWGMADCDNNRGELYRAEGDLEQAERWYRAALEGFQAIGAYDVQAPQLNLSLVRLLRGEVDGVERALDQLLRTVRRRRALRVERVILAMQLALAGTLEDWAGWDGRWEALIADAPTGATMDTDYAEVLDLAACRAEAAGQGERAEAARALAAATWRELGRG